VDELEKKAKVGSKQCVALVQYYAHVPHTGRWKAGQAVLGNYKIMKGTAIATFENGCYPNRSHGNHAAFFVRLGAHGIWMMDQWNDDIKKPVISLRFVESRGVNKDGLSICRE
jgi:hypothetical protein